MMHCIQLNSIVFCAPISDARHRIIAPRTCQDGPRIQRFVKLQTWIPWQPTADVVQELPVMQQRQPDPFQCRCLDLTTTKPTATTCSLASFGMGHCSLAECKTETGKRKDLRNARQLVKAIKWKANGKSIHPLNLCAKVGCLKIIEARKSVLFGGQNGS